MLPNAFRQHVSRRRNEGATAVEAAATATGRCGGSTVASTHLLHARVHARVPSFAAGQPAYGGFIRRVSHVTAGLNDGQAAGPPGPNELKGPQRWYITPADDL